MRVVVDTSVWSLALRRATPAPRSAVVAELGRLIADGRVVMLGPVRQELLSGIRELAQFERLREHLSAFPDLSLTAADFETAAAFFNACRAKGIQGSNTDFLICAAAARRGMAVFTTDKDFSAYRKVIRLQLHS